MAKCTQEADNVLILQEQRIPSKDNKIAWHKYIEICKNRFDGDLGKVTLKFDKEKLSYSTSLPNNRRQKDEVPIPINNDLTNSNNEINIDDNLEIKNFSNK
jgi:twinkle protein